MIKVKCYQVIDCGTGQATVLRARCARSLRKRLGKEEVQLSVLNCKNCVERGHCER